VLNHRVYTPPDRAWQENDKRQALCLPFVATWLG